jgi:nicotinamidase-related amidase
MTRALILVDVQRNMLEGPGAVPGADDLRPRIEELLRDARAAGLPVVHVQNDGSDSDPDSPGTPGWELVFAPADGERVIRKTVGNAFEENPDLDDYLRGIGVDSLTVAGLQSEHCVRDTVLGAVDLGFDVDLASGAHGTYDDDEDADVIESRVEKELAAEGVTIVTWASALG